MIYFTADVHLGLPAGDAPDREERFVSWLKGIRRPDTEALYLLGDIWDFWYEYRDVIPREGARVVSEIIQLVEYGIEVCYIPGNHDIWLYSFWQDMGVKVLDQPYKVTLQRKNLLVGHGDGLGGASKSYSFMLKVFHNRFCQKLFSALHPWLAFRLGTDWSNRNRRSHGGYKFRGGEEPLYKFCVAECGKAADEGAPVDYCIFGHFHDAVDLMLPVPEAVGPDGRPGPRLVVLKDWIGGGNHYAVLSGGELTVF